MKTLWIISLIAMGAVASCDDNSSSAPDYDGLCETSCGIDETCNLLDQATVEECVIACKEEAVNQLDGFFEAFVACKESHTCQELSEGGENATICYDENVEECTTDTSSYLDVACSKRLECDGNTEPTAAELDECKVTMHADGNILRCFTASKLDEAITCIELADTCTPDPVKVCVESVLGLTLGSNPPNNNSL